VTLLVIAIVAVVTIMTQLVTLFVLASHHQDGDATSFRLVLRQVWGTIKKLLQPQGLLMIVYLILLLPLGHLGLTTILTKKVAVPPLIGDELSKSGSASLFYGAFLLVVFYVNLRLIFTVPLLGTTSAGVWEAFVTSWRQTRRLSLPIVGILIVVTIPAGMASFLWPP
jgi:glycerophosphoryl diester phosphodiesterase